MQAEDVIEFWFETLSPEDWWKKSRALDQRIEAEFGETHAAARRCELYAWRDRAFGRLAEIIVLDQFSRNMYRDSPEAFAADPLALALSQEAVAAGADEQLDASGQAFLYMPFMHSESRLIHERALELFDQSGLERQYDFEEKHKAIIDRFGRYPHRNAVLGRDSSEQEREFLKQPGSSF